MKKLNYKKILITVLWIIAIAGLSTSLAFVAKREDQVKAAQFIVEIHNNEENAFLSESDVIDHLQQSAGKILDQPYGSLEIPMLEKILNTHPAVENAEVSATINGDVKVDVWQRKPLMRLINRSGESYYLDSKGKVMPLNENYSARVLLVTGEVEESYARRYQFSVEDISRNKLFSEVSLLDDIYSIGSCIAKDSLLSALVHQIYINKDKEFELYPAIGNHKIVFGEAKDVDEKFNKLKLFYTEGLNKSNGWQKYSAINLKYKNLVVCTRR